MDLVRDGGIDSHNDLEAQNQEQQLAIPAPGRTLLPNPIAKAVSLATRSTGFALKVGTAIGGFGFGAAKVTTLSSLEVGRSILEGILSRAGRDVIARSGSELGRQDAETILERSLENLHYTMTQVVFWTSTGFQLTEDALYHITDLSRLTLNFLDSFLGSTESSRAIASIITLIRREFNNPATGQPGEKVGVVDLLLGLTGLALIQGWAWKLIEEENRRMEVEEVVWDVVVLSDGQRVDVHEDSLYGVHSGTYQSGEGMLSPEASRRVVDMIQCHGINDDDQDEDDGLPEIRLKRQLMHTLPADAKVSISTETTVTKTITVDVVGTEPRNLATPPGVELVEQTELRPPTGPSGQVHSYQGTDTTGLPIYRVVYRINKNRLRSTDVKRDPGDEELPRFVEQIDDTDEDTAVDVDVAVLDDDLDDAPPPLPPKSSGLRGVSSLEQLERAGPRASLTLSHDDTAISRPNQASPQPDAPTPSNVPLPKPSPENSANQKRPRLPISSPSSSSSIDNPRKRQQSMTKLLPKKAKSETPSSLKPTEKKGGFRNALKKGAGPAFSSFVHKDNSNSQPSLSLGKGKDSGRGVTSPTGSRNAPQVHQTKTSTARAQLAAPIRDSSLVPKREAPRRPPGNPSNYLTARTLAEYEPGGPFPRSPSRASYLSIHERRRDSIVSQTDTYSIHSVETQRPVSPTYLRAEVRAQSSMTKSRSERDIQEKKPPSPLKNHRRALSHAYSPSIYTLKTNDSQYSIVPYYQRSAFNDAEALSTLRKTGTLEGMFPNAHLIRNITRYILFSSASYGSSFLRFMGISKAMPTLKVLDDTHHEVRSFAHHTEMETHSVLLASFADPQGGSGSTGSTETGMPLLHFVSLDDESKAVVLTCRGTWGFEDVLTDMTCEYDNLVWRGKSYKVHKGVHASARRLLYGGSSRVLVTIKAALEENPDYGLVLTGHSLGGAVAALLGVMLSEPALDSPYFVTSDEPHTPLLSDGRPSQAESHISLPPGRPIHVYAYGPPATMSATLRKATRGLITSVIQGNDLIPYLSLGVLHDFQAVALAFKSDNDAAKQETRQRVWAAFQAAMAEKWYNSPSAKASMDKDEKWAFASYKTLRASMMSEKLMPPGEVFIVETTSVLRRDAFMRSAEDHLGRPAKRIVLKYVKDVEARFREVRFGTSMLTDHAPPKYEAALKGLKLGVVESGT